MKKFSSKQVLEILGEMAKESLPPGKKGTLHLSYTEDDGVEILFAEEDSMAQA